MPHPRTPPRPQGRRQRQLLLRLKSIHIWFLTLKRINLNLNSDLNTLRDFWIAELEGGDENNLVSVNYNDNTKVLKFESVTANFYSTTNNIHENISRF